MSEIMRHRISQFVVTYPEMILVAFIIATVLIAIEHWTEQYDKALPKTISTWMAYLLFLVFFGFLLLAPTETKC